MLDLCLAPATPSRSAECDDASSRRSNAAISPSAAATCAASAPGSSPSSSCSDASTLSLRSSRLIWSLAKGVPDEQRLVRARRRGCGHLLHNGVGEGHR
uniref:Uncharacterized protein n=1 Tax=Arundo donax TaxID=35708 RepID=A0A0A8YJY4_ARUDO